MANNRMYLLHIPTGLAVYLGKRGSYGWCMGDQIEKNLGSNIALLYQVTDDMKCDYEGDQDDYVIALEDAEGATYGIDNWRHIKTRDDGLKEFEIKHANKDLS